jgi:hypothetical protein
MEQTWEQNVTELLLAPRDDSEGDVEEENQEVQMVLRSAMH